MCNFWPPVLRPNSGDQLADPPLLIIATGVAHKKIDWGCVIAYKTINWQVEMVDTAPSFRQALQKTTLSDSGRRILRVEVLGGKIPYSIEMADNSPYVFAGLWEGWSLERGYIFPRHSQITIGIASRIHPRNINRKGQSSTRTS